MAVKLPQLYADSYHLSLVLLAKTKGFPKHYRPTLARRLEERALDLCMVVRKHLLTKKQSAAEKRALLTDASHAVDDLKFLWQLCRDLELKLSIPFHKRHPLASDPVPFLGFVVSHDSYRILTRNQRRHRKQLHRLKNARPSTRAEVVQSFTAWQTLEPHLSTRLESTGCLC